MMLIRKVNIKRALLFISSVIICLWPVLYNGFPILFHETSTYILTGHNGEIPVDRSYFYSFFLRHVSLSWRLLPVVLAHSFLFNYILLLFIRYVVNVKKAIFIHFIIVVLLAFFTNLAVYISSITHDIFTSLSILCLLVLLKIPKHFRWHILFVSTIFCFAILTKYSNSLLIASLLIVSLILNILKIKGFKDIGLRKLIYSFLLIIASFTIVLLTNLHIGSSTKLFPNHSTILFGKYLDLNIIDKYIQRNCNGTNNEYVSELCNEKEYYLNAKSGDFLWSEKSPLYQKRKCLDQGWTYCWKVNEEHYSLIIDNLLTDSKARNDIIATSIAGGLSQLIKFNQPQIISVNFEKVIEKHYPADLYLYNNSSQNNDGISFKNIDFWSIISTYLSFYVLIYFTVFRNRWLDSTLVFIVGFLFLSIGINAFVNASFFIIHENNQASIVFLLLLSLLVVVYQNLKRKIEANNYNLGKFYLINNTHHT